MLGGGIGGGGGGGGVARDMRQLAAEERAGREASAREDERLRGWIQVAGWERSNACCMQGRGAALHA
mgnify:CR=1 FL=1